MNLISEYNIIIVLLCLLFIWCNLTFTISMVFFIDEYYYHQIL